MNPRERIALLGHHLHLHGRISLADCRAYAEEKPAKQDLDYLRTAWGLSRVGQGRSTFWIMDRTRDASRGVLERITLRLGRELASFLQDTPLIEALDRASTHAQPKKGQYLHLDRKFHYLGEPARSYAPQSEILNEVLDALLRDRALEIVHSGRSRLVQPLTLVLYRRALYLQAMESGQTSTYALDRVTQAASQPDTKLDYPQDWDPKVHWANTFGVYPDGEPEWVRLRFDPKGARYARSRTFHPSQRLIELDHGALELRFKATGKELVRLVLEWGPRCQVIEPEWLREQVVVELGEALALYAEEDGEPGVRSGAVGTQKQTDRIPKGAR